MILRSAMQVAIQISQASKQVDNKYSIDSLGYLKTSESVNNPKQIHPNIQEHEKLIICTYNKKEHNYYILTWGRARSGPGPM